MTKPALFVAAVAVALSACAVPARLGAEPAVEAQAQIGLNAPGAAAFFAGRAPAAQVRPLLSQLVRPEPRCTAPDPMPDAFPADSLAPRGTIRSVPLGGAAPAPIPNLCGTPTARVARR